MQLSRCRSSLAKIALIMTLSIAGLTVWAALFFAGRAAGSGLIVGFFASLPFASTAFVTLDGMGGSSPLLYILFVIALLAALALRKDALTAIGSVLNRGKTAWIVAAAGLYAAAGAYILPRLFEGTTTVFIPIDKVVKEVPLGPVSGNITQTAYFLLGVLTFIVFSVALSRADSVQKVTRGFFALAIAHALLGWIDLGAKLSGSGDVLAPIRTASYALLTEIEQSGFWRIVGGCAEASSFAAYALAALAFSFTYWREANSKLALALTALMLGLVLLSTSSTAYVGCAALAAVALLSLVKGFLQNRLKPQDITVIVCLLTVIALLLALYIHDDRLFAPFTDLIRSTVFEKASSASGQERAYWNMRSLETLIDTDGLGIGMGSSRSSSWPISTLSQLGVLGSALMLLLVMRLAWGMGRLQSRSGDRPYFALCAGARACALAFLLAQSIAGGTADPGVLFFASLATVVACRHHVRARRREDASALPGGVKTRPRTLAARPAGASIPMPTS